MLHFGNKQWLVFDFDKWLGNDDVITGSQALGVSLQCWHLNVSVLALECFSAGTFVFQCCYFSVSVLAFECFSAGTLALCCFQFSVLVLALWHRKAERFGPSSC